MKHSDFRRIKVDEGFITPTMSITRREYIFKALKTSKVVITHISDLDDRPRSIASEWLFRKFIDKLIESHDPKSGYGHM